MTTQPYPAGLPDLELVRVFESAPGIFEETHRFDGGELRRVVSGARVIDGIYDDRGQKHRVEGPAYLTYLGGILVESEYYFEGRIHRVGGPAVTMYSGVDGSILRETYQRRGRPSRLDGPAVVDYRSGRPSRAEWWAFGEQVVGRDGMLDVLCTLGPRDLRGEITDSVFGTLLAEGVPIKVIVSGIEAGVVTVEGMRTFAHGGTPVEWVVAFESGIAR